ncbi:MAG: ATP synthase F1 subunit delta [Planctomycetaceae bacterium]|nr:ATP synthase F1 subunit delta [Planctomycetaceae bacterium]
MSDSASRDMSADAQTQARRCADAVLDILGADGPADRLYEELQSLQALQEELAAMEELLVSENLAPQRRQELIASLFESRRRRFESPRGELKILRSLAMELGHALEWRRHKVPVTLTTAVPLTGEQIEEVSAQLQEALGAEIILTSAVDAGIVGGAVVKVGQSVYDASVAGRLRRVRDELKARLSGQRGSGPSKEGGQ